MKEIFKHVGLIFLLALLIFFFAIVFVVLERYCVNKLIMPAWLLFGMHFISISLFILDGILILATAVISICKILKKLAKGGE